MTLSDTCLGWKPPARRKDCRSAKLAMAVCAILLLSLPVWAADWHKQHAKQAAPADPGYVFALATANRFLHAWQSGDLETGMALLTDRVRHAHNPESFEQFFSAASDRAFEMTRGTGNRRRYRFAVVLVTAPAARVRRRFSEIIVVNTGKNDWAVDKLP